MLIGVFIGNSILLGVALAMDAFSVSVAHGLSAPNMKSAQMVTIAGVFAFFQFLMPMIGWICVHTIAAQFLVFEKLVPWIALILLAAIGIKMIREGVHERRATMQVDAYSGMVVGTEVKTSDGAEANAAHDVSDQGTFNSSTRGMKNTDMLHKEAADMRGKEAADMRGKEAAGVRGKEAAGMRGKEAADMRGKEAAGVRGKEAAGMRHNETADMRLAGALLFTQGIATSIDALSVGFTISSYGVWLAFAASVIIAVVTLVICIGGVKIGQKIGARFTSYASIIGGLILIAIGLEIFIRDLVA